MKLVTFLRSALRPAFLLALLVIPIAWAGTVLERQTFAFGGEPFYYTVYLPDGYDTDTRSYPVVYLLHGWSGQDTDWVRFGDAAFVADRLISTNAVPPLILVMADAGNSWYVDGPDYGRFEAAFLGLIEHVDATYRTVPERSSRAVAGLSMGGYGTARFAIKYPERFAAAAVMSGAIFPEVPADAGELFAEAFGSPIDRSRYRRELPETLLRRWTPDTQKPSFYVTVGDDDTLTPYALSTRLHGALERAGIFPTREALAERIGPRFAPYLEPSFRQSPEGWQLAFEPQDILETEKHLKGDYWAEWLASDCPALVVRGSDDRATTPEEMEQLAARRPNTRLVVLEGGHIVHADDVEGYAEAVKPFMAQL